MAEIFANFQRFRKALNTALKRGCRSLDLDLRQASVLKALADLGPSSAVDLCQATISDPATIYRTVSESVRQGWICQIQDPRDHRCCRLTLTPAGSDLSARVIRLFDQIEKVAFQPFPPSQRLRFNRDLQRLTEHLNATVDPLRQVPRRASAPARHRRRAQDPGALTPQTATPVGS